MIGDEYITESNIDGLTTALGVLRLLSPTDCIKDRLANCYYSNDQQCYQQALMVALQQPVDWENLRRWHENERQTAAFDLFLR